MLLLSITKNNSVIKLLSSASNCISAITDCIDNLFELNELLKKSMADYQSDYSAQIKELKAKVAHLKDLGIIGFPLDLRDAELYALDKKLNISEELALNYD